MIEIRPIRMDELVVIEEIGTASYPSNYYEGSESFRSKISENPAGCFVGFVDGELAGYVISFPYIMGKPHPINEIYVAVDGDCLYLHDLCVAKWARGSGLGASMADVVLRPPGPVALTAVLKSESFWEGLGFNRLFELEYYGAMATYMVRP